MASDPTPSGVPIHSDGSGKTHDSLPTMSYDSLEALYASMYFRESEPGPPLTLEEKEAISRWEQAEELKQKRALQATPSIASNAVLSKALDPAYGFFKTFPPEIRDEICEYLFQEKEETIKCLHFKTRAILPQLRVLSRQFRTEYEPRANKISHLDITDSWYFAPHDFVSPTFGLHFPRLATFSTSVHFNLLTCCHTKHVSDICRAGEVLTLHMNGHAVWIKGFLAKLPWVQTVSANVRYGKVDCAIALLDPLRNFTSTPGLTHIAVVNPVYEHDKHPELAAMVDMNMPESACCFEGSTALVTWTPEGGWIEHPEAIEEARKEEAKFATSG